MGTHWKYKRSTNYCDGANDWIEKYFYHMSRRWDLQKNNGLIVMLPPKNISESLKIYNKLKNSNKLNSAKILDLRIPERVVINYE